MIKKTGSGCLNYTEFRRRNKQDVKVFIKPWSRIGLVRLLPDFFKKSK